IPRVGDSFS
ncbi:hypothetical protein D018_1950B, partial [Vibrio parahaemolyticus VP2007-007]